MYYLCVDGCMEQLQFQGDCGFSARESKESWIAARQSLLFQKNVARIMNCPIGVCFSGGQPLQIGGLLEVAPYNDHVIPSPSGVKVN